MGDSLALVTGGGFGLGRDLARHLRAAGLQVLICGRREAHLDAACAEIEGLHAVQADITVAAGRERLFEVAYAIGAPLDLLVNNAAISRAHDYTSTFTLEADHARTEIEANFAAPIELIRMYLRSRETRGWTDRPGTIANVSTPGAMLPLEANPLYVSTKAGLHMFTLTLRGHLHDTPVRVVEIFPPALDTGLAQDMFVPGQADNGPEVIDAVAKRSVEGILAGEEEILPHPQSEKLVAAARWPGESLAPKLNRGIKRNDDWARAGS
ncbi:MAG: SDR family NAD(P)-dependent oxidoreductase [Myxococcota bacterium]